MKTKIMFCTMVLLLSAFAGSVLGGTEGAYNTFYGYVAGADTTGYYDTFIGSGAGQANTIGDQNTFLGEFAGDHNHIGGINNTFLGGEAGFWNTTGNTNTFLGFHAGYNNDVGNGNTFLGDYSGGSNTTGNNNTFLGDASGPSNTTGSGNVFLGYYTGYLTGSNRLYVDNTQTSPLIYGEFDNRILTINGNLKVVAPDNGLIYLTNVTTDNTTKVSRMVLDHYSNAQLPVYLFGAASTATNNFVAFGGGNTIGNAATQIDLYTASDTTTPIGSPRLTIVGNGNVGIGIQTPSYPLQMASGARVTIGGVWTNASSRNYKENIEVLSTEEALDTLKELNPVKFAYKADRSEKHLGFIAEEVPEIVSMKDRKGLSPMDIVAVLTKVVQEQQQTVQEQQRVMEEQQKIAVEHRKGFEEQQKTISTLSEKVTELERALKAKEE